MEVHHHAHTARNNWKHYLWEFFMLFLAVFCGFLAEIQVEHYVEHKRAKVYAVAMIKNLETDIEELKQVVDHGQIASDYLDTFLLLVYDNPIEKIPTGKLYWYGLWGGYLRGFESNDAAYQQMKNSGSLRYFKNPDLEEAISAYDQLIRSMRVLNEIDRPVYLETRKARSKLFNFRYNYDANRVVQSAVYRDYQPAVIDSFIKINPPLLSKDEILFNEYIELCRSRNLKQQLNNAKLSLDLAEKIVAGIKKEFHLE
jgi:hypothetical protein